MGGAGGKKFWNPRRRSRPAVSFTARGRLGTLAIMALLAQTRSDSAQVVYDAADPNLVAMPYPRVRLVHSMDHAQRGATAHLRAEDPFLLYQLGRDLVLRQFTQAEGVY